VALAGAGLATAIVFLLGWRSRLEPVTIVISGLLVGVTCSAVSAALTLSQGEYLMSLVTWNGGSLSQQDWSAAKVLAVQFLIGLVEASP
jgi:ferric hydroxamate transport system permease protein